MSDWIISASAAHKRAALLACLRRSLDEFGFIEVTTPVVQRVRAGGPRPFQPFSIEGDQFELRHSIELLLRSALASLPRVYDIGPAVRFADRVKTPRSAVEFSLLELYAADLDYGELVNLAEKLIREAVSASLPTANRVNVARWFVDDLGIPLGAVDERDLRRALLSVVGCSSPATPVWELMNRAIEQRLEPMLTGFTFLLDYPIETVCLARRRDDAGYVAERFEVFINGLEVAHGFVDATDPDEVWTRMQQSGPNFMDEDFVRLLRRGDIPPSAGVGIGIERLLLATDTTRLDVRQYLHGYQHL